jgi:hypothetical protein
MNTERFKKYISIADNGCWIWIGSRLTSGYGQAVRIDASARWKQGKSVQEGAHRVSYKLFKGDIPNGQLIRHMCANKLCVNPDHLQTGTQKQNMDDFNLSEYVRNRKRNKNGTFA